MKPLIVAHRGFSAQYTENTLAAFAAAIDHNCDMIELDVHFSLDQELVVHHDYSLRRMTHRKGVVSDYTSFDLQKWNIPALKDVFKLIKKRVPINIEIKHETIGSQPKRHLMVKKLLQTLEAAQLKDQVLISSFDDSFLTELRKHDDRIRLGLLDHGHPGGKLKITLAKDLHAWSYHINYRALNEMKVKLLHEKGLRVFAYTANHLKQFKKLYKLKVDGIITNEVHLLHQFLKSQGPF